MILDLPIRIHNFGADHRFLLTGCWNMDNCLRKMNDSSSKQENKIKKFDPQLMISACGWIFGFTLFSLVFSSWWTFLSVFQILFCFCLMICQMEDLTTESIMLQQALTLFSFSLQLFHVFSFLNLRKSWKRREIISSRVGQQRQVNIFPKKLLTARQGFHFPWVSNSSMPWMKDENEITAQH